MTDEELVKRLRGRARFCRDRGEVKSPKLHDEAADRIEQLVAINEALTAQRSEQSPSKTQDVIAWEKLPDWAEWVARYENGRVFTLPTEPFISGTGWWVAFSLPLYRRIDDFPGIVQIGKCDWRDSKQRRPRG
jgi:hypothetical protein